LPAADSGPAAAPAGLAPALVVRSGSGGSTLLGMSEFFYNISTGQVEEATTKGQSKDLLGPYPTREAAAAALETARKKTEAWDEEDRRWKD
jgi:hypothetical protein